MKVFDLINMLTVDNDESIHDMEVRIGDVSEADDLHCSVGKVVMRGGCIVLVPGDDDVWKDEALASTILSQQLWPEEEENKDDD
ncbi:MAG: hypothetical protein KAJ19_28930 [Gammaproteobacteria bacterium]|nr:hypothetical protein [Gammaproteobacteria bacterium]